MDHKGWVDAGHGDQRIALEEYILCTDRQYHRMDHYGHILPARVQLLDMPPEEAGEVRGWGSGREEGAASGAGSAGSLAAAAVEGISGTNQRQMQEKVRARARCPHGDQHESACST